MAQAPRTLFGILLEQPWWISALAGVALFGIARVVFEPVAPWVALPFLIIAAVVGFKQLQTVSPDEAEERLKRLRDMSWDSFQTHIAGAYQRDGFEVSVTPADAFDLTLKRNNSVTLLQCRRWKVNQLGAGPLQDLAQAVTRHDADNGICITAGTISTKATQFASANPVRIVSGIELATLVGNLKSLK